jgi:hypothetical protein
MNVPTKRRHRVCVAIRPLLKVIGLGFFLPGPDDEEPKKVLSASTKHIIARNVIHIFPLSALAGILWLNCGRYFIGPTFIQNPEKDGVFMVSIQVCAKLLELLCVASLAAIVLQALRHELLGDGIPLGLLGSGIWFSSLGAFWSPQFLGSFGWRHWTWPWKWRWTWPWKWYWAWIMPWTWPSRSRLYVLLIISGLIAVTIGPASAYLMLPRQQALPAGGVSFFMNDTTGTPQFWPAIVTAESQLPVCALVNATKYPVCPSGGYESLHQTLSAPTYLGCRSAVNLPGKFDGGGFAPVCQARGAEGNREWYNYLIQSGASNQLIPPMLNGVRHGPGWASNGTAAMQPHATTVLKMHELRAWWWKLVPKVNTPRNTQYKWSYDMQTQGSATSPWVRTSCSFAQNLSADAETAMFPYLLRPQVDLPMYNKLTKQRLKKTGLGINDWARQYFKPSSIAALNRNTSSNIRTQWVSLPIEEFGDTLSGTNVTGLLMELPWLDGSRVAIGCSVAAAWHSGTVRSERSTSYDAFNIIMSANDYAAFDDSPTSELSNKPVTLSESWLGLLTAPSPEQTSSTGNSSLNTLESVLHDSFYANLTQDLRANPGLCGGDPLNEAELSLSDAALWALPRCSGVGHDYIEAILATMVVDGLSRYGSHRVFNTTGELRQWRPFPVASFNRTHVFKTDGAPQVEATAGLISQWFEVYVVGYSYYPNKKSDWISLVGICVYLLLIVCHIFYSIYQIVRQTKTTSDAWDSVTELLVLCQNSQPPNISRKLDNTSAGIEHWKTYNSIVKVRAFPHQDGGGKHQLRLVLDDDAASIYQGQVTVSRSGSTRSSTVNGGAGTQGIQVTNPQAVSNPAAHNTLTRPKRLDRVRVDQEYS